MPKIESQYDASAYLYVCFLLIYILATSNVISGRAPTCESVTSWWIYRAAPLEKIRPPEPWLDISFSHIITESVSPCPFLIMPSSWLGREKYQFCKSLLSLNQELNSRFSTQKAYPLPILPPSLVLWLPCHIYVIHSSWERLRAISISNCACSDIIYVFTNLTGRTVTPSVWDGVGCCRGLCMLKIESQCQCIFVCLFVDRCSSKSQTL